MFSIQEFLIFIGEPEAKRPKYSIIAAGVLSLLESIYKIVLHSKTITVDLYSYDNNTLYLEYAPITSVDSITHPEGTVDFTFDPRTRVVTLTTPVTDYTKPFTVTITAGYTSVPDDLRYAVYAHIQSVYFSNENHIDNVEKVTNTTGNSTVYKQNVIPDSSRLVYDLYSNRQVIA